MSYPERANPYQRVADAILAQIGEGVLPWRRPWSTNLPQSVHGHVYKGINQILLASKPFSDPRWLTFNMISNLRGRVPRGTKATPIVYWNVFEAEDEDTNQVRAIPTLKIYHVFNVEQCENLTLKPLDVVECDGAPVERAEEVIANLPWNLTIKTGQAAYWSPTDPDAVTMPAAGSFRSMDAYYSTLFHEVAHATGHASRQNRSMSGRFGDEKYGLEELVAQFSSAFVCSHVGIDNTIEQDAAYISGWADAIRRDPKMIMRAASLAQKAADYILGTNHESAVEDAAA